ncbi:MAG: hypothetical protein QOG62_906 [Thermoleophilaceae bacterium]|nr:hypothetical protein [Thermoleophilaceae bacterium]
MTLKISRMAAGLGVTACAALAIPAASLGATTVGQVVVNQPEICPMGSFIQKAVTSGPNYVIPTDGVITSWQAALTGNGNVALRVYNPTNGDPDTFTPVLESAAATFSDKTVVASKPTRLSVKAGQVIGITNTGVFADGCAIPTANATDKRGFEPTVPALGAGELFTTIPNSLLNVAATLEADADKDGYGDETQDLCPTDATSQAACKVPGAPDVKGPKKKTKSTNATFKFSATDAVSYECKIDKKAFSACSSPKKYKKLKPGKHKFRVHGLTSGGAAGADSRFKWTVEKK